MNLQNLINQEIEKFDKQTDWRIWKEDTASYLLIPVEKREYIKDFIRKSLEIIAEKSIEAVETKEIRLDSYGEEIYKTDKSFFNIVNIENKAFQDQQVKKLNFLKK